MSAILLLDLRTNFGTFVNSSVVDVLQRIESWKQNWRIKLIPIKGFHPNWNIYRICLIVLDILPQGLLPEYYSIMLPRIQVIVEQGSTLLWPHPDRTTHACHWTHKSRIHHSSFHGTTNPRQHPTHFHVYYFLTFLYKPHPVWNWSSHVVHEVLLV